MLRLILILAALWAPNLVLAQDRLALVVGIDDYDHVGDLTKAGNDARAVSGVLEDIGFEVTTLLNADERAFNRELASFTSSIDPGDEVVFYFAGHGIEIEGRNYLLPSDAPDSPSERVIRSDSIDADEVLREVQRAGASIAVMILDACRDNPYASSGRSVGGARGLNIISAPVGSFVLMSAASGAVAFEGDDEDPNSIFTRALLPLLQEPGLPLPDLARQLRRDVQRLASDLGHQQRPAYYDEVAGEFFFRSAIDGITAVPQPDHNDPCLLARIDWERIGDDPTLEILYQFSELHSECDLYRIIAQGMIERILTVSGDEIIRSPQSGDADVEMVSSGSRTEPNTSLPQELLTQREAFAEGYADVLIGYPAVFSTAPAAFLSTLPSDIVRSLQLRLSENGYYQWAVDGVLDSELSYAMLALANDRSQEIQTSSSRLNNIPATIDTQTYDNGGIYEGDFRGRVQHGIGTYRLPNGYEYVGTWVEGEIRGQGRATFPDGSIYEGSFVAGQPEGTGSITFADGSTYEGEWAEGRINGTGTAAYSNGVTYVGQFQNALHHGMGVMIGPNGYRYEGGWLEGLKHGEGTIIYPDGAAYTGQFEGGQRAGTGRLVMADGVIYEGQWADGQINGTGTLTQPNGDVFEGTLVNGQRQGTGVVRYANGDIYEGEFADDLRHGIGIFTATDGYSYTGQWNEGRIAGQGRVTYPDGSVYEGQFADDFAHGTGAITYPDGSTYTGDWFEGVIQGEGTATYANGLTYVGQFLNARQHGLGVISHLNGYRYEGQWEDGLRYGQGRATYADGSVYDGTFVAGERSGQGWFNMPEPNSFSYIGEWAEGEINGFGIATYSNGDVYEGRFVNGRRQGEGTMRFISGEIYRGYWVNGLPIEGEVGDWPEPIVDPDTSETTSPVSSALAQ